MARFAIKKVDKHGRVIKNFKAWRLQHPEELYHDSKLEYNFYTELTRRDIVFDHKKTFLLQENFRCLEWCVRSVKKVKVLGWHKLSVQPITWTPDFILTDYNIVLEAKGKANERFANILKMFRFLNKTEKLGLKVVVLHSMKELIEFLDNGLQDV